MKYKLIGKNDYSIDNIKRQYLINRGFKTQEQIDKILNPSKDILTNPFKFDNMERGIELLKKHLEESSNIIIIVDSDVDGYTSSSIIYRFIDYLKDYHYKKCESNIHLVIHEKKTHGILIEEIEGLINKDDIKLVIVPDAGSNDYKQHMLLKKMGIDTLVIDHHQSDKGYSEDAIVINNQLSNVSVNMCGASMSWYFCIAFECKYIYKIKDKDNDCINEDGFVFKNLLQYASIGLIGDMMDTNDLEVQYMIQMGIDTNMINIEFIRYIIEQNKRFSIDIVNQNYIAFKVVPLINAVVRMGKMKDKELILKALLNLTVDDEYEYTMQRGKNKGSAIIEKEYEYAYRIAKSLKGKQDRLRDKIIFGSKRPKITGLMDIAKEQNKNNNILVLDASEFKVEKGLLGVISGQLSASFDKPVIVLTKKNNGYSGSCRNNNIENLREKLTRLYAKTNKKIDKINSSGNNKKKINNFSFEGHEYAFGVSIPFSDTGKAIDIFSEVINKKFKDEILDKIYYVDFEISSDDIDDILIMELFSLNKLFSRSITPPLIAIPRLTVNSNRLKTNADETMFYFYHNDIKFMKFDRSRLLYEKVTSWNENYVYKIVGTPFVNTSSYDNGVKVSFMIEDIELIDSFDNDSITNDDFDGNKDNIDDDWEW